MPPYGKRRRGKHGSKGNSNTASAPAPSGPQDASASAGSASSTASLFPPLTTATAKPPPLPIPQQAATGPPSLILTSEKRRGVYECDYCRTDISQLPRIRCAVCPDFDLCLDCFVTTDHNAASGRLRAAAQAQKALFGSSTLTELHGIADPAKATAGASSSEAGGSAAVDSSGQASLAAASSPFVAELPPAVHHDATHGYRVCDSTRFPLFMRLNTSASAAGVPSNSLEDNSATTENECKTASGPASQEANDSIMGRNEDSQKDGEDPASTTTLKDLPATTVIGEGGSTSTGTTNPLAASWRVDAVAEDPKTMWTAEEDLRLLEGIRAHGLGNWTDISETVSGQGSVGKTPKRCMERYLDDYLGRYGCILPQCTLIMEREDENVSGQQDEDGADSMAKPTAIPVSATTDSAGGAMTGAQGTPMAASFPLDDDSERPRASKRRAVLMRSPATSSNSMASRKKFQATLTESLPEYQKLDWHKQRRDGPYLPAIPGIKVGQEVGRDQAYKAEQTYVRLITAAESKQDVERIRKEWAETRLNQPGGPTVLPMRVDDIMTLPGSELSGMMARRGDFDTEWENDAEDAVADMEFTRGESQQDRQLKLAVLAIYNSKLDEREKRKQFILSRRLYDYRSIYMQEQRLPRDERDLLLRMRLFERFHSPQEHRQFIADLLKAKRLRKEIAKLQMYRRLGIRTLAEAEEYELDRQRRQIHKTAYLQKESEARRQQQQQTAATSDVAARTAGATRALEEIAAANVSASSSLWKQYRTTDRKVRKSINRGSSNVSSTAGDGEEGTTGLSAEKNESSTQDDAIASDPMVADGPETSATEASTKPTQDETGKEGTGGECGKAETATSESKEHSLDTGNTEASRATNSDLAMLPKYDLLSPREVELCQRLNLTPADYIEVKKAMLFQSATMGVLDKGGSGGGAANRRTMVKIDAERRGNIVEFMVRSGWISIKKGNALKR